MIMHGGRFNGAQVLRPETVGADGAEPHRPARDRRHDERDPVALQRRRAVSRNVQEVGAELPDQHGAGADRAFGRQAWRGQASRTPTSGIDRSKRVCGVFLSQVLPFYDHTAIDLLGKFETEVYRAL